MDGSPNGVGVDCEPYDRMVEVTYHDGKMPMRDRRWRGGVVLADTQGRIVWWSTSLAAGLERAGLSWTRLMRCCDALGCATIAGDAVGCLTRHALAAGDELEPLPWSCGEPDRMLHGTITARPISSGAERMVAFELQFRDAVERGPAPKRDVRVAALGRLSVSVEERSRDGDWLQQRPGQVFRYLIASREGAQRSEAIASALWPERGPSAVANVRYCIFKLREQLGERGDPADSLVARDAAGYRIDLPRVELDVDVFQAKSAAGITAHRNGDAERAEALLGEALALYRGEFLADDPYADWAFSEREYLRALAGKGLAAMAQIALAGGRLVGATDHLLRLAQLEPFDSHVHQMLIEVCLRRGRRTEALRHYHALRARLHRAFGELPDFELTSVAAGMSCRQREPAVGRPGRASSGGLAFDAR
jgi:DNA-binding SARP family transcriptional activator